MILIGIPIGFYGYIFPGNINLMVLDLYTTKKYRLLIYILSLILIFESIYCYLTLSLLATIKNNTSLFSGIEIVSFIFIFIMGIWMLMDKRKEQETSHKNTLKRGVISIIFHPQQIPFWLIIGLIVNPFLEVENSFINLLLFLVCNALGSLLAMLTYMYFGKNIMNYFKLNIRTLNAIMGIVYILISISSLANSIL